MTDHPRYSGYNVLDKRHTPSWNQITREVIDRRLAVPGEPRFFSGGEWRTADALCRRILPQPPGRAPVPLVALLDAKLHENSGDGFREGTLPYMQDAWRRGLAALDAEAAGQNGGRAFAALFATEQDALLRRMQRGEARDPAWGGMEAKAFFTKRILVDIPALYYGHPTAWSEIGYGGPASPRGYVRMGLDRRDPWEAVEAKPGGEAEVRKRNSHVV